MGHEHAHAHHEEVPVQGGLVMVCGAARSGTTMLDLMLGNSPDAFSTGEIFAYFRPHRKHHFHPQCSCGSYECEVWKGLLDKPASEFHATILGRDRYNWIIDSSKDLCWVYDSNLWAREHQINCHNVVIWKDPIDLAHSHWKRGRGIEWYRRAFMVYYGRFLDLGLPFVSLNYNELAANPEAALRKLCERLGMPYDERRMNFWEKEHHYFFGSAGTKQQVKSEGGSRVQNARQFPQEFLDAFAAEEQWLNNNPRFTAVLEALQNNDLSLPVDGDTWQGEKLIKPAWYYRHMVKSAYRRVFPGPGAVR